MSETTSKELQTIADRIEVVGGSLIAMHIEPDDGQLWIHVVNPNGAFKWELLRFLLAEDVVTGYEHVKAQRLVKTDKANELGQAVEVENADGEGQAPDAVSAGPEGQGVVGGGSSS